MPSLGGILLTMQILDRLSRPSRAYLLWGPMRKRQHETLDGAANLSWKTPAPLRRCLHRDVGFRFTPVSRCNDCVARQGKAPINWATPARQS